MPAVFDDLSDEIQKSLKYEMKMCWAPLQSWPDITLQICSKNIRTGRTFIIYMFTFLAELVNSDTDTASPALSCRTNIVEVNQAQHNLKLDKLLLGLAEL